MVKLTQFDKSSSLVTIETSLYNQGDRLQVDFSLIDPASEIVLGPHFFDEKPRPEQRKDELWKKTCFEIFLKDPNSTRYFEFNFSTEGYWNIYDFYDYRKPQPPLRTDVFKVENWKWRVFELSVLIQNTTNILDWQVGLTAVLQPRQGQNSYWALQHAGAKADFHHFDSFSLIKRGDKL